MLVLLTDFGTTDPFVGIMKGAALRKDPGLRIVDLTHGIPPQDVAQAAFVLRASLPYFPKDALFVTVVDPGVGTGRRILYAETKRHRFLAPDNGILGLAFQDEAPIRLVEVTNAEYFLKPVSRTFHGRDIFAPVAAALCAGLNPQQLGPPATLETVAPSPFPEPYRDRKGNWHGQIVYVDHFGNLITNLWQAHLNLKHNEGVEVLVKGKKLKGLARSYHEGPPGPMVLLNSFNTVEIAVSRGSAARVLRAKKGEEVTLRCPMSSS